MFDETLVGENKKPQNIAALGFLQTAKEGLVLMTIYLPSRMANSKVDRFILDTTFINKNKPNIQTLRCLSR